MVNKLSYGKMLALGFYFADDVVVRDPQTGKVKHGVFVHAEGDEVGERLLARIDSGEITIEAAMEEAEARQRIARHEAHAIARGLGAEGSIGF